MGYGGGGDGGARALEEERAAKINQGKTAIDTNFAKFDDNFYAERADAFTKYAAPTFSDQLSKSRNSLAASLARRGLLASSAALKGEADLTKYAGVKQREIADQATSEANALRSEVEGQRSELMSQLNASADPMAASAGALSSAARLKTPSPFKSLGNFFADWSETWQQNQTARAVDPNVPSLFSFGKPQKSAMSIVN